MRNPNSNVIHAFHGADNSLGLRHVFIRDLMLECLIGIHKHEKKKSQHVRINVDLGVLEGHSPLEDKLENVVCYEDIVEQIRILTVDRHVNLLETLAQQIADLCLGDNRVQVVRVRVEKLDVLAHVASVGIEIERLNTN